MPIHDYRCRTCKQEFELVQLSRDEAAVCPSCASRAVERLVSVPAARKRVPGLVKNARAQAAREGHFSHYARSEKTKL